MATLPKRIPGLKVRLAVTFPLPNGFADASAAQAAVDGMQGALKGAGFVHVEVEKQWLANIDRPDATATTTDTAGSTDNSQGSEGGKAPGADEAGSGEGNVPTIGDGTGGSAGNGGKSGRKAAG